MNKKMLKKLVALGVAAAMAFTAICAFAMPATANESFWSTERPEIIGDQVLVYVNGLYLHTINGEAAPFIENERTMVPLRALAEAFEFNVDWLQDEQQITLSRDCTEIVLVIGSDVIIANVAELRFYDAVPTIINDRTFLPIRRLAEILDIEVDWCNDARTAIFTRRVERAIADGVNIFGEAAHRPAGVTATQNGLTMTVLQTIADRHSIYVVYEIIAECGYEFSEEIMVDAAFMPSRFRAGEQDGHMAGGATAILEREGNRITLLHYLHATSPFEDGPVELTLWRVGYNLFHYTENTVFGTPWEWNLDAPVHNPEVDGPIEIIIGGEDDENDFLLTSLVRLEWELVFVDTGINVYPNLSIPFGEQELTLTRISISPISANIIFEGSPIFETPPSFVTIFLADGTEITFNTSSDNALFGGRSIGMRNPELFEDIPREELRYHNVEWISEMTLNYRFDYIINVNDIVKVNVGNATVTF